MGADLIVASLGVRCWRRGKKFKDDMDKRIAKALRVVEKWKRIEDVPGWLREDHEHDEPPATADSIREAVKESLDYVGKACREGYRDVWAVDGGRGILVYISGGLSWGDTPTDSYDHFVRAGAALEDARNERKRR